MRKVVQLQTEDWPDLTAPEEPRYLHDVTMSCIAIRLLLDLVHKTNDLQEVNRQSGQKAGDKIFHAVLLLFTTRHDSGALQRRSGKDRNLPGGVQALARLHEPQREGALRLFHRARPEEAAVPYGSEETAICLHCKVSQVWEESLRNAK